MPIMVSGLGLEIAFLTSSRVSQHLLVSRPHSEQQVFKDGGTTLSWQRIYPITSSKNV